MTWLRIDDKFARHPKITRLQRGDRWTWVELLCYCAEYETDGFVPDSVSEVVPKVTGSFLNRCCTLHLLDVTDEHEHATYRVHDWTEYNPKDPTKAERQARWRRRQRNGRVDGGVDGGVDADVDGRVDDDITLPVDAAVDPPARAGARVPSPSPTPSP